LLQRTRQDKERGIERLREGEDVKRKEKALKGGKRNRNRRRERKRVPLSGNPAKPSNKFEKKPN
jgi:hypothetical protein